MVAFLLSPRRQEYFRPVARRRRQCRSALNGNCMSKVAIIGAGFIGRAWAITFARAGHDVALCDQDGAADRQALSFIELGPRRSRGQRSSQRPHAGSCARCASPRQDNLEAALAGAVHVQENTPEDLEIKKALFAELDAVAAPETVLSSSTSALLPSHIFEGLPGASAASSCTRSTRPISSRPPKSCRRPGPIPKSWTRTARLHAQGRPGADRDEARDRRLHHEPHAGRAPRGGLPPGRRRLCHGRGCRYRHPRRPGPALVVHGAVRDHRPQCAGRRPRLCRRYQEIYERLFPQMQRRVDWAGEVLETVERDRREKLAEKHLVNAPALARPPPDGARRAQAHAPPRTSGS